MNIRCFACVPLLASLAAPAPAQDKPAPKAGAPATATATAGVEYRPPARGAPRVRVGGSTRSIARALSLVVLTPDHVGLAATDQPEFFWYISQSVKAPLEFSIVPMDGAEPLVEAPIAPVTGAGIQRIRVSDLGVKLKPGEEYQWTVSLMRDPQSRYKEAVASGRVRVQVPQVKITTGYAGYARAGYWYDAMAELRRQMAVDPSNADLAAAQRSLLEQVGLAEIVRN